MSRALDAQGVRAQAREDSSPAEVRTSVPLPVWLDDGQLLPGRLVSFNRLCDGQQHVALLVDGWQSHKTPLVRVHSECLTGDVLGSARCDCGPQLRQALHEMGRAGGILLYLRQEGRGIGLYNKLDAYALQDDGLDTYEANVALDLPPDSREFTVAAQMLLALGVTRCELLTNNPDKYAQLIRGGVDVARVRPTGVFVTPVNRSYLQTKVDQSGHGLKLAVDPHRTQEDQ